MLVRILSLYLQSLLTATLVVLLWGVVKLTYRRLRKKDQTPSERQATLYEMLLIAVMVIPILAFAVMGLILVIRV